MTQLSASLVPGRAGAPMGVKSLAQCGEQNMATEPMMGYLDVLVKKPLVL